MKNTFFALFLLYILMGCNDQKLNHQKTVTKYYNAFDSGNYNKIKTIIDDSVTIAAGDYVTPYSRDSFYEFFKWDSVFKTSYKIIKLEEKNNQIITSVALSSVRNEFLKNKGMTCQYMISFNSGKISKIEELESKGVNWNIWAKERDSLVRWINKNHPKLDGFVYDMTMKGAQNYLEAIALYEAHKDTL